MPPLIPATDARFEQMRKLTEISRALTYTTALDEVLRLATERAVELLSAESALLMLADADGLLRVRAAHGVEEAALERFHEPLDETLIHRLQGLLDVSPSQSFLGVPLVAHGAVTGLLAVVRPASKASTEDEEWLLSAVADQVAVALENARLEQEMGREREERARAMEEAGEADGAKDRALATISHDLRSPLNAIDSYAELIEMELLGPVSDRQREALGRIRMSGRHLLAVLENVLEMERITAGAVGVHATSVRAAAVIEEAVLMVRPSALAKEQSLVVEKIPDLVFEADPDRLRQVLVNLLGNAVKYTPSGGSLRVVASLGELDGHSSGAISISDTGPGIPADKLQSIFRPYYRIPSTDDTGPEGTGLGLAISRELVRRMGGDIQVESEPGHGCTFTVHLPTAPALGSDIKGTGGDGRSSRGSPPSDGAAEPHRE
ncbi:MAG TPA: HAMP domain-containing sensor histidine kinase [Longimicrobiaceae bacterium]|nr:HAMP domain-containing sensor histidine kinase [Longimicrobiaceae bacterium]